MFVSSTQLNSNFKLRNDIRLIEARIGHRSDIRYPDPIFKLSETLKLIEDHNYSTEELTREALSLM